ncbi:hypothetical protein HPB47_001010 [Ixodes persulcatus]|uniref:Uncharacterized protein n=1 Tax=Ixodes persulcatus TaxID=34615 RepID=A0AC60PRW4_IXOPE|nr:hypothetical protein HPB47_001010 [Ixodes persulcatus]
MSQPTVCRIVGKVTDLITDNHSPRLAKFPDIADCRNVITEFNNIGNFREITGRIDCTHVRIKSPGGDYADVVRNSKGRTFTFYLSSCV